MSHGKAGPDFLGLSKVALSELSVTQKVSRRTVACHLGKSGVRSLVFFEVLRGVSRSA